MGVEYRITCRNKGCGYSQDLSDGPGMGAFRWLEEYKNKILAGEEDAPEDVRQLLEQGHHFQYIATFMCPRCRIWTNFNAPFILESVPAPDSPKISYRRHYVKGSPRCETCGSELIHIVDPSSPRNRCPKCGMDHMK